MSTLVQSVTQLATLKAVVHIKWLSLMISPELQGYTTLAPTNVAHGWI